MSDLGFNVAAFVLPLIGIALSAWSFAWSEKGATPDSYTGVGIDYWPDEQTYAIGCRRRARIFAKMSFNAGALCLAAAVPLGNAVNHQHDSINLLAISGYTIIVFAVAYCVRCITSVWVDRRRDAFNIYFSKEMWSLYDKDRVRKMYFALNAMPIWNLFDEDWYHKRRLPNINEVAACASKAPEQSVLSSS